jgi:outer membrane beta-barrel protein
MLLMLLKKNLLRATRLATGGKLFAALGAVLIATLLCGGSAAAQDKEKESESEFEKGKEKKEKGESEYEEVDKLPAVQNRLYRNEHEFNLGIGLLPIDSYYKGVTFTGGYAWHITDIWAVEGHFSYLKNIKTSLRDKLENNFGIPTTRFAEILYYGEAGALFKPIYGKLSLLNKTLVYGEFYLSLAAIVARMNGGKKTDEHQKGKPERMAFGGAPGFGIRGFINRYISVRFDFRYMMLYSAGEGHFPLVITLSAGFTTRSDL